MLASVAVTRALRLIGVIAPTEAANAEDMVTSVEALNSMLFAWAIDGIDLNHATVTQFDELLIDDPYLETVIYALAARIAPEFGAVLDGRIDAIAERGKNLLRARFETPNTMVLPAEVRQGPYWRWNWNSF